MPTKLHDLVVHEVSGVDRAANQRSFVLVKADVAKGAVPFGDLPIFADRQRPWNVDEALKSIRSWASSDGSAAKDTIDWGKYRKAFTWYDDTAADGFGAYKGQIAEVIEGTLYAVPRGVFALAAVLQGARGGISVPEADKQAMRAAVGKYYAKMRKTFKDDSIVAPWESKKAASFWGTIRKAIADFTGEPEPAKDFATTIAEDEAERAEWQRDCALWELTSALQESISSILDDVTVADKRSAIVTSLQQFLATLGERGLLTGELLQKAGRALSADRMSVVQEIKQLVDDLIASATTTQKTADQAKEDHVSTATNTQAAPVEKAETIAITKADWEALQKNAREANERATAAEAVAKAEKDAREEALYVAKAAKDFAHIPMAPADLGKLLKSLYDKAPEDAKLVEGLMMSADEAIAKGDLFREIGTATQGPTGGSAYGQIEAIAKAMFAAKEAASMPEAIAKVAQDRTDLYAAYQAERAGGR